MRSTDVDFTVPPGAELQEVLITVEDRDGKRTVYRGYHQPGERIRKKASGVGPRIAVEVYLSGLVVERREI